MVYQAAEHALAMLEGRADFGVLRVLNSLPKLGQGAVEQFHQRTHFFIIEGNLHGVLRRLGDGL